LRQKEKGDWRKYFVTKREKRKRGPVSSIGDTSARERIGLRGREGGKCESSQKKVRKGDR